MYNDRGGNSRVEFDIVSVRDHSSTMCSSRIWLLNNKFKRQLHPRIGGRQLYGSEDLLQTTTNTVNGLCEYV